MGVSFLILPNELKESKESTKTIEGEEVKVLNNTYDSQFIFYHFTENLLSPEFRKTFQTYNYHSMFNTFLELGFLINQISDLNIDIRPSNLIVVKKEKVVDDKKQEWFEFKIKNISL